MFIKEFQIIAEVSWYVFNADLLDRCIYFTTQRTENQFLKKFIKIIPNAIIIYLDKRK